MNSSTVLIELIEIEKTFELFFSNEGKIVSEIIDLAVDPANSFNHKYLLKVLITICKQLKPQNNTANIFKDLDDDNNDKKFDPESLQGVLTLHFLKLIKDQHLIYNLLLTINTVGSDESDHIRNQNRQRILKIGQARIFALELIHQIFSLLHPSHGPLMKYMITQMLGEPNPDEEHMVEMHLGTYVNTMVKRQIINTMLHILKNYSYCSVAN